MTVTDATNLISFSPLSNAPMSWADLGAGSGTFTKALAQILPKDSTIYAIDKKKRDLDLIPDHFGESRIIKQKANFLNFQLANPLDGILMGNALHYVRKKTAFMQVIHAQLKAKGQCLIVEYDTRRANPWVPFPIPFKDLEALLKENGFANIQKIGTRASLYGNGEIYAALATKFQTNV